VPRRVFRAPRPGANRRHGPRPSRVDRPHRGESASSHPPSSFVRDPAGSTLETRGRGCRWAEIAARPRTTPRLPSEDVRFPTQTLTARAAPVSAGATPLCLPGTVRFVERLPVSLPLLRASGRLLSATADRRAGATRGPRPNTLERFRGARQSLLTFLAHTGEIWLSLTPRMQTRAE